MAVALLCAVSHPAAAATQPVERLHIEMDPDDVEDFDASDPLDAETSVAPVAVVDGERRLPGRIELKGSSTRALQRKGFLIKLDPGVKWQGESRVVVDSRASDPTLMRDWLAYDLWRSLGMVGASARYLHLHVNGKGRGPFLQVGWIGADLFERAGLGRDGELYTPPDKPRCGDLSTGSLLRFATCYNRLLPAEGGTEDALRDLVAAIDAAPDKRLHEVVDRYFDAESVVNWFVANSVVANGDAYNKNYFLYRSRKSGKWHIVPFDFDLSHGRTYDPDLPYPRSVYNDGFMYWYPLEQGAPNPLHLKALRNPVLYERMRQRFAELMDGTPDARRPWRGWMSHEAMERRIDSLRDTLQPLWAEDPPLGGDGVAQAEHVQALRHYYRMRRAYLRRTVVDGRIGRARDVAEGPLPPPGRSTEFVDDQGMVLAAVTTRRLQPPVRKTLRAGTISITVTHGEPRRPPPGVSAEECVQRSWYVMSWAKAEIDAIFDYRQDAKRTTEVGEDISDERRLSLFLQFGENEEWRRLPTAVNPVSNSLATTALPLAEGESVVLLACEAD